MKALENAVEQLGPVRDALELVGGTGIWTKKLALMAEQLTVLDASPEMNAINQSNVGRSNVRYREQDLFQWIPDARHDLVFASVWLSHVPPRQLPTFLANVRQAISSDGRFFFIDGLYNSDSTANNHSLGEPDDIYLVRKLNDGHRFRIVKVFYQSKELQTQLSRAGFCASVQTTGDFFWYAVGSPTS